MGIRSLTLTGFLVSCALGCALGAASIAQGATGIVLGDSLGVGLAEVSHLQNFAHISVHIRGPKAVDQIHRAPAGTTAFVVLGTNDANGSIAHLEKSVDDILAAAEQKHLHLVWIGPPCVHTSWDSRSRELDKMLAERLPPRGVTYVPMRDAAFCNAGLHEPDGVHLKTKGYVYMWDKARRVAGFGPPTTLAAAPSEPMATDAAPAPKPEPTPGFALAAAPVDSGGAGPDEPKIYVLRVKRGGVTARAN
jgi:hypothetical protein